MRNFLTSIFLLIMTTNAFTQNTSQNLAQAEKFRKTKLLQYYSIPDSKISNFYQIAARLRLGQEIEKCKADFEKQLEEPSGDMFYNLPMMGCYLHGYKYWTSEIHEKVEQVWQTYLPYRGDTENHWIMWHAALLLAAQTWPEKTADEWANGRSSEENYLDGEGFLNFWFETVTTIGQGEFDSPAYLQVYLGSLFVLYDFIKDPVLKQKVEMALHWLLADYAIDYLSGAYTGGHSRIYDRDILNTERGGAIGFGYIFWGDTPFPRNAALSFAVFAALSSYQIPEIIKKIATDRSTPFAAKERKRVRNIIRFGEEKNPPVYKTNFLSKNFSLGCLDGGLQQPIQIHTWGITYLYDNNRKFDEFFTLHPYYSAKELGMFFPEKLKIMVSEVVKSKGTYNKEDKWTGGSPFERTFQHNNAIIILYDLENNTPYKHIDYYFPKSLTKREEEDGWIFARGGNTYIAVKPFKDGSWKEEQTCFRFTSPHLNNGLVAEAFEASHFQSWQKFKEKMKSTKLDLTNLDSDVEAEYLTASGDQMKFRFPDNRYLNGKKINLSTTPLFESRYLQGNNGVLKIQYGKEQFIIDFNKNEIIKKVL